MSDIPLLRKLARAAETDDPAKRLRALETVRREAQRLQDLTLMELTPTAIAQLLHISTAAASYRRQHAKKRLSQ